MTVAVTPPELHPADVVRTTPDGVANGANQVLTDDIRRHVPRGPAGGVAALHPRLL